MRLPLFRRRDCNAWLGVAGLPASLTAGCAGAPAPGPAGPPPVRPVEGAARGHPADPGAPAAGAGAAPQDGQWTDAARQGRVLPWRLYLPASERPGERLAWVVFSHGLGGSRLAGEHWGRHWATQGIASLHLQHAGSDRAVFERGIGALQAAMNAEQLLQRVRDARFVLDEVARRAQAGERPWARLAPERVGIAGHSFGAVTTQALAGQRHVAGGFGASPLAEPRFKAAIAFSPSARGGDPARAFGSLRLPFMSLTGTRDNTPLVNDVGVADRLLPFEHMPGPDKYLALFDGASHAAFSGSSEGRRLDEYPAATERIRPLVQQLTGWFWQAYLGDDAAALQRLREAAGTLAFLATDRYQMK